MFKIESYVTPILMNYVAKYVKNIRPQDAQLSLWGGEVVLQNLDLRLDVLEDELQLPFELLSGHIHELIIHVPWTKITSEPIQITINTIEFVLKLKDPNASNTTSGNGGTNCGDSSSSERKKKLLKIDDNQQQQQGYVPGLVNKIINNISINCHNIILKYVEEDIVVSMNVQLLSFSSADENWQKAFIDVSQTRVFLRKLIQISDLTICLDKRNAIGLIDVCQEPILYRCSLEIRMFKKYNAATAQQTSHTRVDIFSKAMEINVSSLQFPMVMRLLILVKVLKDGDLKARKSDMNASNDGLDDTENTSIENESYLSWAWNLIPSVFPIDDDQIEIEDHIGHIMNIGIYLSKLNITLKSSELFNDSIVQSTRKIRYDPILKISLEGIYSETNMIGRKWFNATAGVSKMSLEPLGNFAMLSPLSLSTTSAKQSSFLLFTDSVVEDNYLENSLFQNGAGVNIKKLTKTQHSIDLDDHLNEINENYLLYRTPVFAFDMVHFINIPDDSKSSDFGSDFEYSNLSEQSLTRVFISSITLKYNSTLINIIDAIQELIKTYNYPPYVDEKKNESIISKIPPPSVDDFDALMNEIPQNIMECRMKKLQIEFHSMIKQNLNMSKHQHHQNQQQLYKQFRKAPFINLLCDNLNLIWTKPLYPSRLVYITSQLPEKPKKFMDSCYDSIQFHMNNLNLQILSNYDYHLNQQQYEQRDEQQQKMNVTNFLNIPEINGSFHQLLKQSIWQKNDDLVLQKFECNVKDINFEFSKCEFLIVYGILSRMFTENSNLFDISNLNELNMKKLEKELRRIRIIISELGGCITNFSNIISYDGNIKSINGFITRRNVEEMNERNFFTSKKSEFCRCVIQWPITNNEENEIEKPPFVAVLISDFEIIINKTLTDLLSTSKISLPVEPCDMEEESSLPPTPLTPSQPRQELETTIESSRKSTIIHDPRTKRQLSHPQESVHLSSEKEDTKSSIFQKASKTEPKSDIKIKIAPILKCLVIWIDIKQSMIVLNEKGLSNSENNSTIILLPRIQCKCKELNDLKELNLIFPIHKILKEWKSKKVTFPWLCTLSDLTIKTKNSNIDNDEKYFIHPINANITLALDDKKYGKSLENELTKRHQQMKNNENITDKTITISRNYKEDEILAFNLHIDTKPIFMELSEDQALILRQTLSLLMLTVHLLNHNEQNTSNLYFDDAENEVPTSHEDATIKEIKDFLALNTNSEDTSSHTIVNYSLTHTQQTIIFLLMQWTVTKITISLKGCSDEKSNIETKLNFDFEDFIVSIDCQLDYFKFKCKVGSLNMQYYERSIRNNDDINEWKLNDYFKIKIRTLTEDTQHHIHHTSGDTFFDLTLTIAKTSDYFKRLGIKKNIKNINKSIAEIDVHIKGVDILLDLNKLEKFVPVICCIPNLLNIQKDNGNLEQSITKKNSSSSSSSSSSSLVSSILITDLPLLFAESQGITLYIPVKTGKSWCDVFIFKIGEMYITPLVKHPLPRNPIRPDVYNKAAQLQILDIPGSKLEDRQYEFSLKNISAATGNWKDILSLIKENSVKLKNTNPAFEWNHQSRKISLELNPIFNDFLITVTYAPCIIYKNVLVCGTAVEINCVTDLIVTMNTHQLHMMSIILDSFQNINKLKSDAFEKYSTFQQSTSSKTIISDEANNKIENNEFNLKFPTSKKKLLKYNDSSIYLSEIETTDSGIASSSRPNTTRKFHLKHKISKDSLFYKNSQSELYIPYKIELVAGLFIFKFFQNLRTSEKLIISSSSNGINNNEDEPSSSTSPTTTIFTPTNDDLIPLLACDIKTSMLVEYKSTEFLMKFFIYTMNLNYAFNDNNDENIKNNSSSSSIIETLTGHLNSTGIPPTLLTFEYKIRTFSKKTEIDLQFGCPIKIHLSCNHLKHLFHTFTVLCDVLKIKHDNDSDEQIIQNSYESSKKEIQQQQITRKLTKIQMIRYTLYNAHKFSISTDKFFIEFHSNDNSYNICTCFGDINAVITIIERPEKLSLYISSDTLYIQTERKMLLHPVRFIIKLTMQQENWHNNPLLCVNSKFDVVHCDISPKNIQNCMNAIKDFNQTLQHISNEYQKNYKKCDENNKNDNNENYLSKSQQLNENIFKKIQLPEPRRKSSKCCKEEFYQDDLRAGAFQFVELYDENRKLSSSSLSSTIGHSLPHPYQIQIISRNNGIVCWRYPQPRRICKLQIYPVPMETSQPTSIKCRMEYYSEPHNDFLHYCDFSIIEMETQEIELPEEKITACVWRVIILQSMISVNEECFRESTLEGDEEAESTDESDYININDLLKDEHDSKSNFILQPKALVACMRIDTAFSPSYIPKIKFFTNFSLIQINLQIQQQQQQQQCQESFKTLEIPLKLRKFKLTQNSTYNHTFLTILLMNSQIYMEFLKFNEFSIAIDLIISAKCLDYCCLSMFNLIEDTNIKSLLNIKQRMDVNIVIDTIKLNICTALIHTLLISQQLWMHYFIMNSNKNHENLNNHEKIVIWTRYVICNHTQLIFRFGQYGTNEMINIAPGYCVFYSFRSYYQNKELVFQVLLNPLSNNDNENVITSDPISLQENGEQFIMLNENVLIIEIIQLSQTQKCILLKGQIQVVSMTSIKFGIQFRSSGNYGTSPEMLVNSHEQLSIFSKCVDDEELYFRLRFSAIEEEPYRWSGEIPLKSRKGLPWLVKVPIKKDPQFTSFWIRVIRENIDCTTNSSESIRNSIKPIRILIVIYPMFMIQSNFTLPLTASISSTVHDKITFNGKGKIKEIIAAATNETQHEIIFENNFPKWHGEDRHNAVLTFNNIDWDKFFSIDNKKIKITEFLNEISKPLEINWPLDGIRRNIQSDQLIPVPFFKCLPYNDLSYTLMMSISPWCLLINTLNFNIQIRNSSTKDIVKIDAGKIGMLFPIEDSIIIDLCEDNNVCSSDKISIEHLHQNHLLELIFCKGVFVTKIHIKYNFKNGLRVISVMSAFTIVNFTNHKMIAYPFCLKNNEKIDRHYLERNKQHRLEVQNESFKQTNPKGVSLDKFYFFELNNQKKTILKSSYKFFIFLSLENDDLSFPLTLNEHFNRKCFSLYYKGNSIPFAAICIENKLPLSSSGRTELSQYYLFIYHDYSPVLLVDNQTHFSYYVAEWKSVSSTSAITAIPSSSKDGHHLNENQPEIVPECDVNQISWTNIIRPMCQTFYTPPSSYLAFPDTEKYHCDIILALRIENETYSSHTIQWTAPIHTGYRSEKYFNVPLHGDVKIVVCDKHLTIKVFIFYVSQQTEFCIKDLRTRLLDPIKNQQNIDSSSNREESTKLPTTTKTNIKNDNNEIQKERRECNHEYSEFPIRINLFVNEINFNYWLETKQKPYLNREVLSLFIEDFSISFNNLFKTLECYINNLQIDNQLYSTGNYDFPVILCSEKPYIKNYNQLPTPITLKKSLKSLREKPLVYVHINFYDEFLVETIHCQLNPIRVYIEDTFLNELKKDKILFNNNPATESVVHLPTENTKIFCNAGEIAIPKDILQQAISLCAPIKLRYVRIDPINIILSLHTCATMYVGCDHSPLTFSQYDRRNLLTVPTRFGQTIGAHYFSGFLYSCGWVVGSLEILGSPSGLARSFSTGIRDFVSMPIQGLFRGPWGFFVGISQGSVSLFRNITAGALNSVTKLAVSVSRNLDRLTLDEEHLQRTEALRRSRPQGVTQGLSRGLTGLGINILGAIGGLSRHTLEARSTVGVVTGLGKGIFGAIAKPISGAADLVALTGQGVLQSVGYNTLPEQRRHGIMRAIIAYPAECKILWQLIPSVLSMDQILFYHEATLIADDELKRAYLILTTTVLTLFDIEKDQLVDMLPIERVEMAFDNADRTLINIKLLSENNQGNDDDTSFTNERIIHFLRASTDGLPSPMSRYSLDDLLQTNQKTRLQWSLYVSEHLGQHLFGYLKLIKSLKTKSV